MTLTSVCHELEQNFRDRVPTHQGKQGKGIHLFPVREKTGYSVKMPEIRENQGIRLTTPISEKLGNFLQVGTLRDQLVLPMSQRHQRIANQV